MPDWELTYSVDILSLFPHHCGHILMDVFQIQNITAECIQHVKWSTLLQYVYIDQRWTELTFAHESVLDGKSSTKEG